MNKRSVGYWMAAAMVVALAGCGGGGDKTAVEAGVAVAESSAEAQSLETPKEEANAAAVAPADVQAAASEPAQATATDDAGEERATAMATSGASNRLGGGVTGGGNALPVHVATPADLRRALCDTIVGGVCKDDKARVISVDAMIDFTGTEGAGQINGCYYSMLPSCDSKEKLALFDPKDTHCNGRSKFMLSYDKAGRDNLLVGSNKTVIGKAGGKAGIKGTGLSMYGGVHNIIIRNLTISDINDGIVFAGDAIVIGNARDIWLDHNRFVHIARQMMVSGWEANSGAQNVTVSWNDFDGRTSYSPRCDGSHYWTFLLTGQNESFVFAYNWIHQFSGRAPAVHGKNQFLHLMSNYFQDGTYHALEPFATNAVFVEGNYFGNVKIPILQNSGNRGAVYAPLQPMTSQMTAACTSALGRNCNRNVTVNSGTSDFTADAYALQRAGALRTSLPAPSAGASSLPGLLPGSVGPK